MTDDDRKGPPRRAESVVEETRRKIAEQRQSPARDFYSIKTPIPPRQDDGVPSWEAEDIKSGVHAAEPGGALELIRKRAGATLDATRASLAVTQTLDARVGTVETDVRDLKGSVALVQSSLDAQDKYLKPMVDLVVSRTTVEHTLTKATIEIDTSKQLEQADIRKTWREAVKTGLAVVGPAAALVLGALKLGNC